MCYWLPGGKKTELISAKEHILVTKEELPSSTLLCYFKYMKMVVCFFPALKIIAIKEELQLTSQGKKNKMLSPRKISLFPPLIYNCSRDEFSAPTDSELPPRKEKKLHGFTPFQNPVSFCNVRMTGRAFATP